MQPYSDERLREIAQADYARAIEQGDPKAAEVLKTYFIDAESITLP